MTPEELFQKIKDVLISINFSADEADRQLKELSEIIMVAFHQRLTDFKGDKKNKETIAKLLMETAGPIINDYFKEISGGLNEEEKKEFVTKLNSLAS